jgi:hypothetical protein
MRFSQGYKPSGVVRQQQSDISIAPTPTISGRGHRINRSNSSAVREALVAEFLRDALAADAVPLPELDEKARAKGLLSGRESITLRRVRGQPIGVPGPIAVGVPPRGKTHE